MRHGSGQRTKNTWAQDWQLGMIIGLIRPGVGVSTLVEVDDAGDERWAVSGRLERLEEFSSSEVVPLQAAVLSALRPAVWPNRLQFMLRGVPTTMEGWLLPLRQELERVLRPALLRIR